jgi:hypothetical protein
VASLRIVVASAIVVVWCAACLAAVANPSRADLATITTPVMLAVAGWLYAGDYLERRRQREKEEKQ